MQHLHGDSLETCNPNDAWKLLGADAKAGSLIVDFLAREAAAHGAKNPGATRGYLDCLRLAQGKQRESAGQKELRKNRRYAAALRAICSEQLLGTLVEAVAHEGPQVSGELGRAHVSGDLGRATPFGLLRARAADVIASKRRAACLRREVDLSSSAVTTTVTVPGFSPARKPERDRHEDRHHQLRGFWRHLHASPRGKATMGITVSDSHAEVPTPCSPSAVGTDAVEHRVSDANERFCEVPKVPKVADTPQFRVSWRNRVLFKPQRMRMGRQWNQRLQAFREEDEDSEEECTFTLTQAKQLVLPRLPAVSPPEGGRMSAREAASPDTYLGSLPRIIDGRLRSPSPGSDNEDASPRTFLEPWRNRGPPSKKANLSAKKYLKACEKFGIVPTIMPFVTGHSPKFVASEGFTDGDLQAVSVVLGSVDRVEEVSLSGNATLTDKSVVPFIVKLGRKPLLMSLSRLMLSRCPRLTHLSLNAVVDVIRDGASRLLHLDLSGIHMGMNGQVALCNAIASHVSLRTVHLVDTALGDNICVKQCMTDLTSSPTVQELHVGWNCFTAEVCELFGERVAQSGVLRYLSVANCAASSTSSGNAPSPIEYFIECLAQDTSLTHLDISLNRLDFRGAFIAEDAFGRHPLTDLNLSHNPLGVVGMRSILRLLASNTSGLMRSSCNQCPDSTAPEDVFSVSNPRGRYCLDLGQPYHRSVLRMLYKFCDRLNLSPEDAFTDVTTTRPPYSHPQKATTGTRRVLTQGTLSFTFKLSAALGAASAEAFADYDFDNVLSQYLCAASVQFGFGKAVPLMLQWRSLEGEVLEQKMFLGALSKDFTVQYEHMEELCRNTQKARDIITRLLPGVLGGVVARYLSTLLVPSLSEYIVMQNSMRSFFAFNANNPTGHYRLDLASPSDMGVAIRLLLLNDWEICIQRRLERSDTSQKGNQSTFRNVRFREQELEIPIAEWRLPEVDFLELDYSSCKRPPGKAASISEEVLCGIIRAIQLSECASDDKIDALRFVSHRIFLTTSQLRGLLNVCPSAKQRLDLLALLFFQLTDVYNMKILRVRLDETNEWEQLQHRLGHMKIFPFVQPEQARFEFDFSVHDQRLAANFLLQLAAKEGFGNLHEPSFTLVGGIPDPLVQGVPRTWETFEKMPKDGVFCARYECAPELRNFQMRTNFLLKYGHWGMPVEEEKVVWWSSLASVPSDVMVLLDFLTAHFPDLHKAFVKLEAVDAANGSLSSTEFDRGLRMLGFTKFAGPRETDRIRGVFDFLDTSNENQVSAHEWAVLVQLQRELKLCIQEFSEFLARTFGPGADAAWPALDLDGSGEISEDEWIVVARRVGYFGLAKPMFRYLDRDGTGMISRNELGLLDNLQSDLLS